jgi:hypothetical protein
MKGEWSRFEAWCPVCAETVRLLRLDEAATLTACLRASRHPLEIDKLHIVPTANGLMNVCFNSLLNLNWPEVEGAVSVAVN